MSAPHSLGDAAPSPRDWFLLPERALALQNACERWADTPFRARSAVPGPAGGVDCVSFVAAVLREIGAIPAAIAIPPYDLNHAEHSDGSVLRAWLEQPAARAHVRRVDEEEPHLDGDLVFPIVGRTEHHLALRVGRTLYHVARPSGWCALQLPQVTLHRSRYRIVESP